MKSSLPPLLALSMVGILTGAEPSAPDTLPSAPLSPRVSLRAPDALDTAALNHRATLRARRPLTRNHVDLPAHGNLVITMKIKDGSLARPAGIDGITLLDSAAGQELSRFVAAHDLRFRPQIDLDDAVIEAVETKAAENSGVAQPELRSLFFVGAPKARTIADAHAVTVALNALAAVEYAHVSSLNDTPPPPGDIAPPTADFRPNQTWRGLGSETGGASIDYAWSYLGRGGGVQIIDIEQAYNPDHEDLVDLGIQDFSVGNSIGQTPDLLASYIDHGTKTFGVLAAPDNGYGVVGAAPLATMIGFASNFTDDNTGLFITCPDPDGTPLQHGANSYTGRALVIATNNLVPGDVILLEVQASVAGATGFTPGETEEAVFCTTKLATDAGIIVVGAAGNIPAGGGPAQDLDANVAGLNQWRSWGDSGAIIVGAGEPNTTHRKMSFSAYGSRVNVQAWGLDVLTTGTGFPTAGADPNQSYDGFSGTSSASAVVAATCMAVQSARISRAPGTRLNSVQMRSLLVSNGNPQTSSPIYPGLIGPAVDAQKAIDSLIPTIDREAVKSSALPILYTFGGQTMASLRAWDPVEDANGGDSEVNAGRLVLTNAQPGFLNTPVHAIADWHLDILEPVQNLILEFDSVVIGDAFDGADRDEYLGMADADGIFISNDGEHWTRIGFPGMATQVPGNGSVHYTTSLDAAAQCAGFPLLGHIRIRFQHYGPNDTVNGDGRAYDNVRLSRQDLGHYEVSHAERDVTEGSSRSIGVGRLGDTSFASSVDYELIPYTATIGTDLSVSGGNSGTLLFPKGENEVGLSLVSVQDSLPENTETALLILKSPTAGVSLGVPNRTLIRIIDNDQGGPTEHFVRTGNFTIPGVANFPGFPSGPAPITLTVSGAVDPIAGLSVKVSDLSHAVPALLDIILESPEGSYCKLMSDVGEGISFNTLDHIQFCFRDGAPPLPTNVPLVSGTYAPTDGVPGGDQLLDTTNVGQSNTGSLSVFNGENPNGVWKLHVVETGLGDVSSTNFVGGGLLQGGYELVFEATGLPPLPVWVEAVTLSSGPSRFGWIGEAGSVFTLQRSSNLRTWTDEPAYTNLVMTGALQRFTAEGGNFFYRFRRP